MPEDRLILDRDVPAEKERLGIGNNPVDVEEIRSFTLEADLERFSNLINENNRAFQDQKAIVRRRMKQAEEDKDKMSDRGIAAFETLQSKKEAWEE